MGSSGADRSSDHPPELGNNHSSQQPINSSQPWADEENPFVAFRRYADEQISSMLQSVMGLPSMVTPPFSNNWPSFPDEHKYRDDNRQRNNAEDYSGREKQSTDYNDNDVNDEWVREFRRGSNWRDSAHGDSQSQRPWDFFSGLDEFFNGGQVPLGLDRFPFFSGEFLSGADAQTWPVPYLLFSPYSPLHLEGSGIHDQRRRVVFSSLFSTLQNPTKPDRAEPRWRDAFEDLLRVENGQPMLEQDTQSDGRRETGNEWLRGMLQRGSLGSQWKLLQGPNGNSPSVIALERQERHDSNNGSSIESTSASDSRREDVTRSTEAETELDLYDRFLEDIVNVHNRAYSQAFGESPLMRLLQEERRRHLERWEDSSSRQATQDSGESEDWLEYTSNGHKDILKSQSTEDTPSKPSAISTMTRTERRTLPDGSVKTRTVKTKRFADGSEESDESVEVVPPPAQRNSVKQPRSEDNTRDDDKGASNGGWFWSR
jgi:hypothetical protein